VRIVEEPCSADDQCEVSVEAFRLRKTKLTPCLLRHSHPPPPLAPRRTPSFPLNRDRLNPLPPPVTTFRAPYAPLPPAPTQSCATSFPPSTRRRSLPPRTTAPPSPRPSSLASPLEVLWASFYSSLPSYLASRLSKPALRRLQQLFTSPKAPTKRTTRPKTKIPTTSSRSPRFRISPS